MIPSRAPTTSPFELQVAKGEVPYHTAYIKPSSIASQDTNEAIINAAGYIPAYAQAAAVVKISSASTNDTSAGSGAQTVRVSGLLADYSLTTENISMNGQTAVNTVNSYIRITELKVLTVGGGSQSAGIIYAGTGTVTGGVPATVYLRMPASTVVNGTNADLGPYLAPPLGYELYLTSVNLQTTVSSNTATLLLKYRALTSATWTTLYSYVTTVNGSVSPAFQYPIRIPAGYEYCVTSDASATTIAASCCVYGVYIGG